jgi:electron transport complex protein RnfC
MVFGLPGFKGKGTFPRGVHPSDRKNFSSEMPIEIMPTPERVLLPLLQHIGPPCAPVVKTKQQVVFGDKVASNEAFISASIHTPISGTVMKQTVTTLPNARHVPALPVKAEGEQLQGRDLWEELFGGQWPKQFNGKWSPEKISQIIQVAGIVGLGGAAFPTHVKIMPSKDNKIDTLLINGCECEPYLTSDYRLMLEAPEPIITGALLAGVSTGAKDIVICIENNKPKAIEKIRKAAEGTKIKIAVLKTKYPQGSERHMVMAVLKRVMPLGGLPIDIGVAVSNVSTIAAVASAVLKGTPLTHRIICVTGGGIVNPKNLLVPIGISYGELIDFCGGLTEDAARMISGGPMMGFAFTNPDTPVTKGTSGLTVLTREDIKKEEETACIRCGRCVDVCPMRLVPARLAAAARNGDMDMAEKYNIMGCLETGCCGYICPARIPLIQLIRMGKAMAMAKRKRNGS